MDTLTYRESLTPSQMEAFQLMTNSSQQQLLFVTGPGSTGNSFLIHTVVSHLTLCQANLLRFWLWLSSIPTRWNDSSPILQTGCLPQVFLNGELLTAVWLVQMC